MQSFVKIKYLRIGEITLLLSDIGKLRSCHDFFLTSQICVFTLFAKKNFCKIFQIYSMHSYQDAFHLALYG